MMVIVRGRIPEHRNQELGHSMAHPKDFTSHVLIPCGDSMVGTITYFPIMIVEGITCITLTTELVSARKRSKGRAGNSQTTQWIVYMSFLVPTCPKIGQKMINILGFTWFSGQNRLMASS